MSGKGPKTQEGLGFGLGPETYPRCDAFRMRRLELLRAFPKAADIVASLSDHLLVTQSDLELGGIVGRLEEAERWVRVLTGDPAKRADYAARRKDASRVYFIQSDATGLIKIGCSRDVRRRMGDFRGSSGCVIRLLGTEPGDVTREHAVHKMFTEHRVCGEWFKPADEILSYIAKLPRRRR